MSWLGLRMGPDRKRPLGRGLDALLPVVPPAAIGKAIPTGSSTGAAYGEKSVFSCPIEALHAQKGQPRQRMDTDKLNELAASIEEHGLIEPIVVRRSPSSPDRFEIIAGERRWRAAQRAGLKELLVVVKDVSPKTAFELALIENLQREDLDPIEVAEAIERLIQEHGYTHETVANRLHKDRSTVTNALRLLKLPPRVRTMVVEGSLSEGHARALLGANDHTTIEQLADKAVRGKLSVRKVEALVRKHRGGADADRTRPATEQGENRDGEETKTKNPNVQDLEHRISMHLGRRVTVRDNGGKGDVVISYATLDDLDELLALLGLV